MQNNIAGNISIFKGSPIPFYIACCKININS